MSLGHKRRAPNKNAELWAMNRHCHVIDDDGAIEVWCSDAPDGAFVVKIRTLTYEELAQVLQALRRPPKRMH